MLEQAAAKRAMTVTYHHRHHRLLMSSFAQFLGSQRTMEETLCIIAQNMAHAHQKQQGPEPNQYSTFKDFLDTKPPIFKVAKEPLQTDE